MRIMYLAFSKFSIFFISLQDVYWSGPVLKTLALLLTIHIISPKPKLENSVNFTNKALALYNTLFKSLFNVEQ